jgi:hypothetical protein
MILRPREISVIASCVVTPDKGFIFYEPFQVTNKDAFRIVCHAGPHDVPVTSTLFNSEYRRRRPQSYRHIGAIVFHSRGAAHRLVQFR